MIRYDDIPRTLLISEAIQSLDLRSYLFRACYEIGLPKFTSVESLRPGQRMTAYVSIDRSGNTLFVWGRQFFDSLTDDDLWPASTGAATDRIAFVLAHEALHVALRHVERAPGHVARLWNVACDIVVNALCEWYGLSLLPNCCTASSVEEQINAARRLKNEQEILLGIQPLKQSAEEIYEILLQHVEVEVTFSPSTGHHDAWESLDERTREILSGKVQEALSKAAQRDHEEGRSDEESQGYGCGKLPGSDELGELRELAESVSRDCRVPWTSLLAKRIGSRWIPGLRECWDRPPTRLVSLWNRAILPSRRQDYVSKGLHILTALDASGSMSQDDLEKMAAIHASLPPSHKLTICSFDTRAYVIRDLNAVRGGGGTDLKDVNRLAEELAADVVICLTDGYFSGRESIARPHDWIFVISGTADYVPDGAETIMV